LIDFDFEEEAGGGEGEGEGGEGGTTVSNLKREPNPEGVGKMCFETMHIYICIYIFLVCGCFPTCAKDEKNKGQLFGTFANKLETHTASHQHNRRQCRRQTAG